jgi:hypothetical protein
MKASHTSDSSNYQVLGFWNKHELYKLNLNTLLLLGKRMFNLRRISELERDEVTGTWKITAYRPAS